MTETRILRVDQGKIEGALVRDIAAALASGAVAAYPTETFYALGAAAFSRKAVSRIFRLKKRDPAKPLSFVAADMDMVREMSGPLPPAFEALAGEFWPGPLTLVLPAAAGFPASLLGPGRTVAVRIPPLSWLRAVVRELAEPLTATSANRAGAKEIADPLEVRAVFGGKIDLIVDGGPAPGGRPSTIVDLAAGRPRVLREGPIPADRIAALVGPEPT
ncbi:MAG: Sua5/YciO/YrdC/YwlC family protein [Candidatus Aminicenantes bacterium]|nr:Sua5/YciO/YrdC/YwlC family protein [Candidatus Aminicenantes bacterium]